MHTFNLMKKRLRFLMVTTALIVLNLAGSVAYAQNPKTLEVGPYISGTTYAGDLNVWRNLGQWQRKELNQFSYGYGALARFNYDTRWAFRIDYSHLHLRAGDASAAWRPQGMLNFKSTVDNINLMVEFNFFDYYTGKPGKGFSPYIFGGISGLMYYVQPFTGDATWDTLYFNGISENNLGEDEFAVEGERKGRNYALSIPFGLGCKISISEHLASTVEWRMHYTMTDYLDGVHSNYSKEHAVFKVVDAQGVDQEYDFTDPTKTFPEGYQRGNARTNDWFGVLSLSLTWKFVIPEKSACKMTDY